MGSLITNEYGRLEFIVDPHLKPLDYDSQNKENKTGGIQIWEYPSQTKYFGKYVGGLDPYLENSSDNSASLGSLFIFKRYSVGDENYDCLVAEYTARPSTLDHYYSQCCMLLEYYNASCLYESNVNNFKVYCTTHHKLHLLSHTPAVLKSAHKQNDNNYGLKIVGNQFSSVKGEVITYLNQFLRATTEEGVSNVYKIKSIGLLQELIRYNDTGNFDRVIAFALTLIRHIELSTVPVSYNTDNKTSRHLFKDKLFN